MKGKVKSACTFISRFEETLLHEAQRAGLDGVACGHIHKAEHRPGEIAYYNCGDWVESCTLIAESFDGQISLVEAPAAASPSSKPKTWSAPALASGDRLKQRELRQAAAISSIRAGAAVAEQAKRHEEEGYRLPRRSSRCWDPGWAEQQRQQRHHGQPGDFEAQHPIALGVEDAANREGGPGDYQGDRRHLPQERRFPFPEESRPTVKTISSLKCTTA